MSEDDPIIDDALLDEIIEAFYGAYEAAPSGEGVMGAAEFGARAAAFAAMGIKAPEAVSKAIGEVGHYGVLRKYKLVPRMPGEPL
jgi:hypothetical protein